MIIVGTLGIIGIVCLALVAITPLAWLIEIIQKRLDNTSD